MSDDFFPVPSLSPSRISPNVWPGITPDSTEALQAVLKDNHIRWHVYWNPWRYHNHTAHFSLTLWALGADSDIIKAAYQFDCDYQRPAFKSPDAITAQNFADHLGDDEYYTAYLKFYTDAVRGKSDLWAVLEEYIFDLKMNFDVTRGDDKKQPEMLNRFLSGLLHPMIHAGHGMEFGLPGLVVESLASAAVHDAVYFPFLSTSLFEASSTSVLSSQFSSALSLCNKDSLSKNVHAFTILSRILKDPQFEHKETVEELKLYQTTAERHGDTIKNYVSEWSYDSSDPKEVERKIEELIWTNLVIYGIAGWTKGKGEDFFADFFHMHLVTSSLFLSSLCAHLKPSSQELLLRSYFAVCLILYIGHGHAEIDVSGFFAVDNAYPTPPGPLPTPDVKALVDHTTSKAVTPNPWLPILETALVYPDEHLPKLQRALAHFGTLYGMRRAGLPDFAETELPGADKLDGTLFIRVAGLTAKRMGRVRDGEALGATWDR